MKISISIIFFTCLIASVEPVAAQNPIKDKECYDRLVKDGMAFMFNKNYGKAINQFWAAYNCNYEAGNDSLRILINKSVRYMEAATESAKKAELAAKNNEKEVIKAIKATLEEKKAKEEALSQAQDFGKKAEAALLASLSGEALQAGNYDKAMAAAFASINMSEKQMQTAGWQALGKVIASMPPITVLQANAEISKVIAIPKAKNLLAIAGEKIYLSTYSENPVLEFNPNIGEIIDVAVAEDAASIAIWSRNQLQVWSINGALIKSFPVYSTEIMGVCFSRHNDFVLVGTRGGELVMEPVGDGAKKTLASEGACIYDLQFSTNGKFLFVRSSDGFVRTWDVAGNALGTIGAGEIYVHDAAFSADNQQVVTAAANGKVKRWQINGSYLADVTAYSSPAKSVRLLSDDKMIVSSSLNEIGMYSNGTQLPFINHIGESKGLEISSLGNRLVVFSDYSVKIFDGLGALINEIKGLDAPCQRTNYNPSDKCLAFSLENKTIVVFDEMGRFLMDVGSAIPATFTSDGQYLITAGNDARSIRLYPSPHAVYEGLLANTTTLKSQIRALIMEHGLEYVADVLK